LYENKKGGHAMRKQILISVFIAFFAIMTSAAMAETFNGTFTGAVCTFYGKTCPTSEGHIALEKNFVLNTADGKTYFVLNVDRSLKVRHINDKIRIIGKVKKDLIVAERVEVNKGGKYMKVWTMDEEVKEINIWNNKFSGS
jgi:hypothetical protein